MPNKSSQRLLLRIILGGISSMRYHNYYLGSEEKQKSLKGWNWNGEISVIIGFGSQPPSLLNFPKLEVITIASIEYFAWNVFGMPGVRPYLLHGVHCIDPQTISVSIQPPFSRLGFWQQNIRADISSYPFSEYSCERSSCFSWSLFNISCIQIRCLVFFFSPFTQLWGRGPFCRSPDGATLIPSCL